MMDPYLQLVVFAMAVSAVAATFAVLTLAGFMYLAAVLVRKLIGRKEKHYAPTHQ